MNNLNKLYDVTLKKQIDLQDFIFSQVFGDEYIGQYNDNSATELLNLAELAPVEPNAKVLDVGCGTAGVACLFAENFNWTIDGIDISETAIEYARQRVAAKGLTEKVSLRQGDIYHFKPSYRYDAVYMMGALCHFDPKAIFEYLSDLLKPDGCLFFFERIKLAEFTPEEYRSLTEEWESPGVFSLEEYRTYLQLTGFRPYITTDMTGPYKSVVKRCIHVREANREQIISRSSEQDFHNSYRLADAEYRSVVADKLGNGVIIATVV
jgi:cyclopropane fatty-acyl-phospholipid synthase-like methyltransferase